MAKINEVKKNVVEVMEELATHKNIQCGIDEVEFPDGTKESFYYNGEEDRQAAITFATICYNATGDTAKAKKMMVTCFSLLTKNIKPSEIVTLQNGSTAYVDIERKLICNEYGSIIAELTEEEKKISSNKEMKLLKITECHLLLSI